MNRTLLVLVLLLLLVTVTAAAAQVSDLAPQIFVNSAPPIALKATSVPSPWFSEWHPSALKGLDGIADIGAGFSFNAYRFTPKRSVWLDLAPFYDGGTRIVGGFAGLSTEIDGIPIVEVIFGFLDADTIGFGGKYIDHELTGAFYAAWHF